MILLLLFLQILPEKEFFIYETNNKGKIGRIEVLSQKETFGYHVVYTSDRVIDVILDTINLGTISINKTVKGKKELEVTKGKNFKVYFKGRSYTYREDRPVYDRHTLDFALRGFAYHVDFKRSIRLHVPELWIVNAELEVVEDTIVSGPLGDIPCWKIKMTPRILFINRKFYFWIEKEYPHRFIKFADSSGKNYILAIDYTTEL